MLSFMCFVARGLPPMNKRVVGVATEAENRSYDYCFRMQPKWTEQDGADKLQGTASVANPRESSAN